ncbi:hypothetical protein [Acidianus two-tailed virus 2]|nr:hypothetical protein [Acidianus two-tailed virus 2]
MKVKYKQFKNGVRVYNLGDKYMVVYKGDVWGIGSTEDEALADASRVYRDSKGLMLEPSPFDIYEGGTVKEEDDVEPLMDYKDVAVYYFPPYYLVYDKEKDRVLGTGMDLDDALAEATKEKPGLVELFW